MDHASFFSDLQRCTAVQVSTLQFNTCFSPSDRKEQPFLRRFTHRCFLTNISIQFENKHGRIPPPNSAIENNVLQHKKYCDLKRSPRQSTTSNYYVMRVGNHIGNRKHSFGQNRADALHGQPVKSKKRMGLRQRTTTYYEHECDTRIAVRPFHC